MSFSSVRPTKPELDGLKSRKKFIIKGKELLEIKKEQLRVKVEQILVDYQKQKEIVKQKLEESFNYLNNTYRKVGKKKIEMISKFNKIHFETFIDIEFMNEMGVIIPKIEPILHETNYPAYSFIDTPIDLDRLSFTLKELIYDMVKLSEIDSLLFHFGLYYKKISRRITGMENIILPKIEKTINKIEDIIEDQTQEEFIRMRKIKEILEKQEEEN